MNIAPIEFTWDGEVMRPMRHYLPRCHKQYAVGENYPMIPHEDRSTNSHNHFFAAVHEAWKNLPERLTPRFPTSEHLRKWALIKSGFADERSIACATADEALKVAAFIKPMDDFAVVVVADATIKVFTAKSQSARAMGKKDFQDSKQAVLDIAAELIGVDAATLSANTQSSAPADAGAASTESAAPLHSSQDAPSTQPETKPAPHGADGPLSAGAGTIPSSETVIGTTVSDEPKQAGGGGTDAVANAAGLPEGWERDYAAALSRAKKPHDIGKRHTEWFADKGGYVHHKGGANQSTIDAIFKAFQNHFGPAGEEARNGILHELGAV